MSAQSQSSRSHPPLRSQIKTATNRGMIKNAISKICLAGVHQEREREDVLGLLEEHGADQFVIMLAESKSLSFRGLYYVDYQQDQENDDKETIVLVKIYGRGPRMIKSGAVGIISYLKFNSATKSFVSISSSSITPSTDAIAIDPARARSRARSRN